MGGGGNKDIHLGLRYPSILYKLQKLFLLRIKKCEHKCCKMKVDEGNAGGFFQRNRLNMSLKVQFICNIGENLRTQSVVGES